MFSSSVRRAALLAPPIPLSSSLKTAIPRAASSRCHQRRQSSSKPSSPADGSKGVAKHQSVPAASLAKDEAEEGVKSLSKEAIGPTDLIKEEGDKTRNKRKTKDVTKGRDSWLAHLPSVPSTHHIDPMDISAASFYALHRPISITNSFPKPVTNEAFAEIFTPRTKVFRNMDADTSKARKNSSKLSARFEVLNEMKETTQNDAEDALNFGQLSLNNSEYQPFNPPPVPTLANTAESLAAGAEAAAELEAQEFQEPQHRTYTAVLTIQESTDSNGEVSYSAHSSPLVEEDDARSPTPLRFLERMQLRQEQYRANRAELDERLAISVKRIRKLKMKKHKYKKLMRRTRNLRRRIERS